LLIVRWAVAENMGHLTHVVQVPCATILGEFVCSRHAGADHRMSQLRRAHAVVFVERQRARRHDPPECEISAADWLTLVEKLGLASYLKDTVT